MTSTAQIHPADARIVPEMELCDRLQRAFRLVGLSVGSAADIMGVRPETVGRWLHGHNRPNKATLMILSDLTGVDLHWLDHGTDCALRGCRDSNPEPSVLEPRGRRHLAAVPSVRVALTAESRPVEPGTRHLRSVS